MGQCLWHFLLASNQIVWDDVTVPSLTHSGVGTRVGLRVQTPQGKKAETHMSYFLIVCFF